MTFKETTIDSKIVYKGPIFRIKKYKVNAAKGNITDRDILEHNGGAVMLAVNDNGKILMERQFRKTMERDMLELPAGKIDIGEKPLDAAIRELKEETGYTADNIEHMITIAPSCGYSRELLYIYFCTGLVKGEPDFDDTEDIELLEFTADEITDMISDGKISDAKTIVGVLFAKSRGLI